MWLMCQMPKVVPRSFGVNQYAMFRAHGGNPIPWNQLLAIQNDARNRNAEDIPKHTFITADISSPIAMKNRGLERSPRKPLMNLEMPYVTPPQVMVMKPSSALV